NRRPESMTGQLRGIWLVNLLSQHTHIRNVLDRLSSHWRLLAWPYGYLYLCDSGSFVRCRDRGAPVRVSAMTAPEAQIDSLDARLIALLAAEPRLGVLECSRRLGVARVTVPARPGTLLTRAIICDVGPG